MKNSKCFYALFLLSLCIISCNKENDSATPDKTATTNETPVAVADQATVTSGGSVVLDLLSNDTDKEGDVLTITEVSQPTKGTLSEKEGTYTYTANANTNGDETLTYTLSDGTNTATGAVTITITAKVDNSPSIVGTWTTTDKEAFVCDNNTTSESYELTSDGKYINNCPGFGELKVAYLVSADKKTLTVKDLPFPGNDAIFTIVSLTEEKKVLKRANKSFTFTRD